MSLLDDQPINIGGFVLAGRTCAPANNVLPAFTGWEAAIDFAQATEDASPYWVADLWNYAENRHDWREKLAARQHGAHRTLINKASIARRVTGQARDLAPTMSHADAVAKLDPADQVEVLAQAAAEELTANETRALVRRRLRPAVLESQARLEGQYRVLYSDTWPEQTTIEELCRLPIAAHALPDAVWFAWVTASHLLDKPGLREVFEAHGFTPKTGFVWDQVLGLPGHYSYVQHEHLIVATRGNCQPDVTLQKHDHASIITDRRGTGFTHHHEKPAAARRLIQSLYITGPYLELFARRKTEGWTSFGSDARQWGRTA